MRFLDAITTRRVLTMPVAIEAMKVGLGDDREVPVRTQIGGSLFMPGRAGPYTGIKVVSVVPGNPAGIVVVMDGSGSPLGLVDGPTITAIRTGAAAGLATELLARPDARVLAMLGAGAMAFDQVEGVKAVRPISRTLIWSRDQSRAHRLAERVDGEVAATADEAVAAASIISTATASHTPLFDDRSVQPGTHINAVGAFTPEMCEIPAGTVDCAYVVVDDVAAAAAEAGDLIQADHPPVCTLAGVLAGRHPQIGEDVTLFKSVGIASQDIAAAVTALDRAQNLGLGVEVP